MMQIQNLSVALRGKPVLKDLSLALPQNQFHILCGANGSGKTTLLRTLCGLVPITAGKVLWNNRDLSRLKPDERARTLTWVPASHDVGFEYTPRDVIGWGQWESESATSDSGVRNQFEAAVSLLGLKRLLDEPMTSLSLGEQKRVQLCRALTSSAPLMILDEPTSALDPGFALDVMAWLRHATTSGSKTVVASFHDLHLAVNFADQLILLNEGGISCEGSPKDVIATTQFQAALGVRCLTHITQNGLATQFVRSPFQKDS